MWFALCRCFLRRGRKLTQISQPSPSTFIAHPVGSHRPIDRCHLSLRYWGHANLVILIMFFQFSTHPRAISPMGTMPSATTSACHHIGILVPLPQSRGKTLHGSTSGLCTYIGEIAPGAVSPMDRCDLSDGFHLSGGCQPKHDTVPRETDDNSVDLASRASRIV